MRYLFAGRQQGKTYKMIISSEVTGYPILVQNEQRKRCLVDMAKEMGCHIPEPIIFERYRSYNDGHSRNHKLLIDDAEKIIESALNTILRAEVVAVTLTDEKFFD